MCSVSFTSFTFSFKIYDTLKERTGHVWESDWNPLVNVTFKGYPSDERRFKPTPVGYIFLKGINNETNT